MNKLSKLQEQAVLSKHVPDAESSYHIDLSNKDSPIVVLLAIVIMVGAFSLAVLIFSLLCKRKKNFFHRKLYFFLGTPAGNNARIGFQGFSWAIGCILWSPEKLFDSFGLDSLVLLQTLKMFIVIGCMTFVPTMGLLLPMHVAVGNKSRDILTLTTLSSLPPNTNLIWIHLGMMYLISIIVCWRLFIEWKSMIKWRQLHFLRNPIAGASLLFQRKHKVENDFYFEDFIQTRINKIASSSNNLAVYTLRDIDLIQTYIDKHDYLLACKRLIESNSATCSAPDKSAPRLNEETTLLPDVRDIQSKLTINYNLLLSAAASTQTSYLLPAAVVIVSDHSLAHTLLSTCFSIMEKPCSIKICCEPHSIQWNSLRKQPWLRKANSLLMPVATFSVIFLWAFPVAFASYLAGALNGWKINPNSNIPVNRTFLQLVSSAITILLPLAVIQILSAILYLILQVICKQEGHYSIVQEEFSIFNKLTTFTLIDTFFVFLLSLTILQDLSKLIENPLGIASRIAETIPPQFRFFILYISMHTFIVCSWELLQGNQILYNFWINIKTFFNKKHRFHNNINENLPISPEYVTKFTRIVTVFGIGLVFAPLAPLVVPVWILFFLVCFIVCAFNEGSNTFSLHNYQGNFWPHVSNWTITYVVVMQLTMIGVFVLKKVPLLTLLALPCSAMTLTWFSWMKNHLKMAYFYPTIDTMQQMKTLSPSDITDRLHQYTLDALIPPINSTSFEHAWEKARK